MSIWRNILGNNLKEIGSTVYMNSTLSTAPSRIETDTTDLYRLVVIMDNNITFSSISSDDFPSNVIFNIVRPCLHKRIQVSFRQILLYTAWKTLARQQLDCVFLPCLQQNYARKSICFLWRRALGVVWQMYGFFKQPLS